MKKNFIARLPILLLLLAAGLAACESKKTQKIDVAHEHSVEQQYTCPMHPQIVQNKPGSCPICGMDLVPKQAAALAGVEDTGLAHLLKPVNEQVVARIPTIRPESGTRIISTEVQGTITYDTRSQTSLSSRVGGRVERLLVKYNYQPVRKGQLILEIYSPDLAAAQRELLYLARTDPGSTMLPKAKERLRLLGMGEAQIRSVLRTGKVLYRVPVYSHADGYILEKSAALNTTPPNAGMTSTGEGDGMSGMGNGSSTNPAAATPTPALEVPGDNSPILLREGQYVGAGQALFTIYKNNSLVAEFAFDPSLAPEIKRGQKLLFYKTADPATIYTGAIGLVQPTLRAGSNFTLARVYLNDTRFQVGGLVTAKIPIVSRGWWVPEKAVLDLGSQSVVFKKEGEVFVPRQVKARKRMEGMVLIEEGVSNWEIAASAAYLVDSESFIKLNSNHQTPNE
jgi:membrane fusion protein, copper/silver efflux system